MSKQLDSAHTSVRLRNKALEAIRKTGRPMAATEIIDYIREHNPQLWNSISEKCDNYVRIILNLTRGSALLKYKPLKPIRGIDKRTSFFGLADVKYPEDQWVRFIPNPPTRKHKEKVAPKVEEPPKEEKDSSEQNSIFASLNLIFKDVIAEEDGTFAPY